jgi:hypothetical protein
MDEFKQTIVGLESLTKEMNDLFRRLSEEEINARPTPGNLLDSTIITSEPVTAQFVITDYLRHQRHHFWQIAHLK